MGLAQYRVNQALLLQFKKGRYTMNKKTVRDIDVKGKKVLVRCDFNVPLDENNI